MPLAECLCSQCFPSLRRQTRSEPVRGERGLKGDPGDEGGGDEAASGGGDGGDGEAKGDGVAEGAESEDCSGVVS